MNKDLCFKLLSFLFLSTVLLGVQAQTRVAALQVYDSADVVSVAGPLEIKDVSDLGAEPARKVRKAVKGNCKGKKTRRSNRSLVKRANIVDLFGSVPNANKVGVGATKTFRINPKNGAKFTTSEFYGCTVIVVPDGHEIIIGHYNQAGRNCDVMADKTQTQRVIVDELNKVVGIDRDLDSSAVVFIIHSSAGNSPGLKAVKDNFAEHELADVRVRGYAATAGTGSFPGQPKGKMVVEWVPNANGGATLNVYIESSTPAFTRNYDAAGNPC